MATCVGLLAVAMSFSPKMSSSLGDRLVKKGPPLASIESLLSCEAKSTPRSNHEADNQELYLHEIELLEQQRPLIPQLHTQPVVGLITFTSRILFKKYITNA